jgi:hypothetical protein
MIQYGCPSVTLVLRRLRRNTPYLSYKQKENPHFLIRLFVPAPKAACRSSTRSLPHRTLIGLLRLDLPSLLAAPHALTLYVAYLRPSHLRRSLTRRPSVTHRRRVCRWPRHGCWDACAVAPQVFPGQAKGTHEHGRCWWCSRATARHQIPPRCLKSTGLDLSLPYIANVCFKCFR